MSVIVPSQFYAILRSHPPPIGYEMNTDDDDRACRSPSSYIRTIPGAIKKSVNSVAMRLLWMSIEGLLEQYSDSMHW